MLIPDSKGCPNSSQTLIQERIQEWLREWWLASNKHFSEKTSTLYIQNKAYTEASELLNCSFNNEVEVFPN